MKIAKIIVDIPLMQTDKPFTYQIPKELSALTEVGMRVHVPFGAGNRLVQGIIVEVLEHLISSKATSGLKKIAELLDVTPVLTKEQLWLADEMRHHVFSYKISCLKAMLPSLLNSNYDKLFQDEKGNQWYSSKLSDEEKLEFTKRAARHELSVTYLAKSKENRKVEKFISVLDHEKLALFEVKKAAKKRDEFKRFLLRHFGEKIPVKNLAFSHAQVKFFIDQGLIEIKEVEISRTRALFDAVSADKAKKLNEEQKKAFDQIISSAERPYLLEGIT